MKTTPLKTTDPRVQLVQPDVDRDAPVSVKWLSGKAGRSTLRLMGVIGADNQPSSLDAEKKRVEGFIIKKDQLNWTITYQGQVVGAIWVDIEANKYLLGPSVHLMIGDPDMRGKGIGGVSMEAVIVYLKQTGYRSVYSRHLSDNFGSAKLLHQQGFRNYGTSYKDSDGLNWQNVALILE